MDENGESKTSKSTNTTLYLVFGIILLIVAGGSYYLGRKAGEAKELYALNNMPRPSISPVGRGPQGPPNFKGQKLSDTNFSQNAVLIYPGISSEALSKALVNWKLTTTQNTDGTTTASLIPVGSESVEGDGSHTFTLKSGDKLYFVDLNPNDDQTGQDNNSRDDMGIVVDANGIIQ